MGRRATETQNKDLTHKDVEKALYKFTDLRLNLRHLSDILSVVGLDIGATAILDRARHRIQLCAIDKLHGTLIGIKLIVQPAGVLDKHAMSDLEPCLSSIGLKLRACELRAQIYRPNLTALSR